MQPLDGSTDSSIGAPPNPVDTKPDISSDFFYTYFCFIYIV